MKGLPTVPVRGRAQPQRALIIGAGAVGRQLAEHLLRHPEHGITPAGFVDSGRAEPLEPVEAVPLLGRPEQLRALVDEHGVGRVVFACPDQPGEETARLIRSLASSEVDVDVAASLCPPLASPSSLRARGGLPLVSLTSLRLSRSARIGKRALDVTLSSAGLFVLSPALLAIAIWIKVDSRGPALFQQVRMGARNTTFRLYKFRTMTVGADARRAELAHLNTHARNGGDPGLFKIAGDPRVTGVGRFLRRYFLDELPQLVNVVKGEMSLVGPRPLVLEEDRHVGEWARLRLDVRPGMTGLWQVLGHSAIPFQEMLKLDYLYVTTWSLAGDLRLLAQTLPVVLRGGGGRY